VLTAQDKGPKQRLEEAIYGCDEGRAKYALEELMENPKPSTIAFIVKAISMCEESAIELSEEKEKYLARAQNVKGFKVNPDGTIPPADQGRAREYFEAMEEAQKAEQDLMATLTIRNHCINALSKITDEKLLETLIKKFHKNTKWGVRAAIAEALGHIDNKMVLEALAVRLSKDRNTLVKVAVCDAIAKQRKKTDAIVNALCKALKSKMWQVITASAVTIAKIDAKEAIPNLIEALALTISKKMSKRVTDEVNNALVKLTGVDKHSDPAAWRVWWNKNKEAIMAGTYEPEESDKKGDEMAVTTTFYGIQVKAKSIFFIIDRSGSMSQKSEWKPDKKARGSATGRGGKKGPKIRLEGDTRLEVAKYELKRVLWDLLTISKRTKQTIYFNLAFYNHEYTIFKEDMVKLTKTTFKQAAKMIDELEPIGATNIYDPLEKAFQFTEDPGKSKPGIVGPPIPKGVEVIFLLSDGMPNFGQIQEAGAIIKKIAEINKLKKVIINAIFCGSKDAPDFKPGKKFMKKLAEKNGGQFVERY
jgi:hypothetical protein